MRVRGLTTLLLVVAPVPLGCESGPAGPPPNREDVAAAAPVARPEIVPDAAEVARDDSSPAARSVHTHAEATGHVTTVATSRALSLREVQAFLDGLPPSLLPPGPPRGAVEETALPSDVNAAIAEARVMCEQFDFEDALSELEDALRTQPAHVDAIESEMAAVARAWYDAARGERRGLVWYPSHYRLVRVSRLCRTARRWAARGGPIPRRWYLDGLEGDFYTPRDWGRMQGGWDRSWQWEHGR